MSDWYEQLQPASFAGLRFKVESTEVAGSTVSATETRAGRSVSAVRIAAGPRVYRFDAYFTGERVLRRVVDEFTTRLESGPGRLVHPYFGVDFVVAEQWSVAFKARAIEFAELNLEFKSAAEPEGPLAVAEPETPTDLPTVQASIVDQSLELELEASDGGRAPEEVRLSAPALPIREKPDDPGFYGAATGSLLAQNTAGVLPVPAAIGALGAALRRADAGQLGPGESDAVAGLLLRHAARTNSPTLLAIRALWLGYVRAAGPSALGRVVTGRGRTIPAIALAAGVAPDVVAARNSDAVRAWFARGDVRL